MRRTISVLLIWLSVTAGIAFGFANQTPMNRYVNTRGMQLPADAAPPAQQVFRSFQAEATYMEWFRTIYKGIFGMRLVAEPLLRVDKNFVLLPAAADRWEPSEDGRTWYFYLRRDLKFSDGRPLTAHDYVFTLRRGADPDNAYDFEWYYRPIKNWGAVIGRKMPTDSLGVRALDDYTLAIETEDVCTYLPDLLIYTWVSPRQAIEKYGDTWSTRAETHISSGPFYLSEWSKGERLVMKANPAYNGPAKPYLETIIAKLHNIITPPPLLAAYEANEIDYAEITSQAELARIKTDPALRHELNSFVNFVTYYLTINTYSGVFANKLVRQAFSHAIDREAITRSALQGFAVPAYSMLPPGFPAAAPEALQTIQRYDPALARQCLAEAGFPDGRGLPRIEMWLRSEGGPVRDASEAIQSMISKNLGITLEVRNIERKLFMDAINSHTLQMGLVPYGYDYVDPSNLMTLWMSNGRHAWRNDLFDRLVVQAGSFMGDRAGRIDLYQQAERQLVDDVGAVFLWHPMVNQIWKSKIKGDAIEPNRYGYRAWRWDQVQNLSTTIYITNHAPAQRATDHGFWERWFGSRSQ